MLQALFSQVLLPVVIMANVSFAACVPTPPPARPPILCCPVALRDRVDCSCPHLVSGISFIHAAERQHNGAMLMLAVKRPP